MILINCDMFVNSFHVNISATLDTMVNNVDHCGSAKLTHSRKTIMKC